MCHAQTYFQGKVQAAALSGLASFVLPIFATDRIDKVVAALGRKTMRGKAHTEQTYVNGNVSHRALPTEEVLKFWKLAPAAVELTVQRLKLW